jgi:hypothetical protein
MYIWLIVHFTFIFLILRMGQVTLLRDVCAKEIDHQHVILKPNSHPLVMLF